MVRQGGLEPVPHVPLSTPLLETLMDFAAAGAAQKERAIRARRTRWIVLFMFVSFT